MSQENETEVWIPGNGFCSELAAKVEQVMLRMPAVEEGTSSSSMQVTKRTDVVLKCSAELTR